MNKTLSILLIILVLVIVGGIGYYFLQMNQPPTAPISENNNVENNNNEDIAPTKSFTINGQNFSFSPSEFSVKKGDKVKITLNNISGFHDFVIDEFNAKTEQFQGPGTREVEFVADKTGTFEFYCSVGEHRQMGMKGNLIVE